MSKAIKKVIAEFLSEEAKVIKISLSFAVTPAVPVLSALMPKNTVTNS